MFTIIYLFAVFLFEWDEARGSLSVLTKQIKWDKLICQKRLPRKDRKSVFLTTASRAELIIIEILFKTQGWENNNTRQLKILVLSTNQMLAAPDTE